METLGAIFYTLLGAAVGSFLSLCIDRLPRGQSIISPPSRCDGCQRRLGVLELVPIVSYLALRGRCRHCGARVPLRVLIVEILTAVAFGLLWLWLAPGLRLLLATLYVSFLIVVAFIDLEHRLVLNRLVYPAIVMAFPSSLLYGLTVQDSLLGGAAGFGAMFALYALTRGGIGAGDVKLATFVGLAAGFPEVVVALFVASSFGGVVATVLLLTGLKGRRDPIPYAPFIALGGVIGLVAGQPIIQWYLSFF